MGVKEEFAAMIAAEPGFTDPGVGQIVLSIMKQCYDRGHTDGAKSRDEEFNEMRNLLSIERSTRINNAPF